MLFENVKEYCRQNSITIAELEKIMHFGNGTIHKWEKTNPSVKNVKMVAEYFEITIDELISGTRIPSKESRDLAIEIDSYTDGEKKLIRYYMSMLKSIKDHQNI